MPENHVPEICLPLSGATTAAQGLSRKRPFRHSYWGKRDATTDETYATIALAATAIVALLLFRAEGTPVQIGVIIPQTGYASNHARALEAIEMAVDELNGVGGINGRRVELLTRDAKSDPEQAKQAFIELEQNYSPLLYMASSSPVSMALAPLAEQHRVVLMGLVVSATDFAREGEWVFRYYSTAKQEIKPILHHLNGLQITDLGILYQDDDYGRSIFDELNGAVKKLEVRVTPYSFQPEAPEPSLPTGELNRLKALYIAAHPKNMRKLIEWLRHKNYPGHILTTSVAASMAGTFPQAEGIYCAAPNIYKPGYLLARSVGDRYSARFDRRFTHFAASGYDSFKLLTGLLQNEEVSRNSMRRLLDRGFVYPGLFGTVDVQPGQHDIGFPLYPARITQGRPVYLQ